jgi:proteasome alpha subunit
MDERRSSVLGGDADAIGTRLADGWSDDLSLAGAVTLGEAALSGPDRSLGAADLEVALLSRSNGRRCFRRLSDDEVAAALGS